MKVSAARLTEHGAPLRVESVEIGQPAADEVLVEMWWGSVNPVDRYAAMGLTAQDGPVPRTLGTEGAGIAGGTKVLVHGAGVGTRRDGIWASAAVVPKRALTEVPEGVELSQAATIGVAGATAWRVVTELARVTAEDRVLVLGASGGVGSMIVSLSSSIGATVWGQSGHDENRDWLADLGAEQVVVTDADQLEEQCADLSPTVVFDPLGDGYTGHAIALCALRARMVLFGTSAGTSGELPLQALFRKGLTIYGYAGLIASEESLSDAKRKALRAVAAGDMRVSIGATFPLAQVNDAFEQMVGRSVKGKVLLDLRT
ncbi:MAG: quinone oxidoreductase family protein [Acidimicrobiales bacterium]